MFGQAAASVHDYVSDLDAGNPSPPQQTFTLKQIRPRTRDNPQLDYLKLLAMLGGALIASVIYDHMMKSRLEQY